MSLVSLLHESSGCFRAIGLLHSAATHHLINFTVGFVGLKFGCRLFSKRKNQQTLWLFGTMVCVPWCFEIVLWHCSTAPPVVWPAYSDCIKPAEC